MNHGLEVLFLPLTMPRSQASYLINPFTADPLYCKVSVLSSNAVTFYVNRIVHKCED
jgi:hypothetical protein